jgi:hypothetical protein
MEEIQVTPWGEREGGTTRDQCFTCYCTGKIVKSLLIKSTIRQQKFKLKRQLPNAVQI